MNIVFHEKTKTFHLYNDSISYIMTVLPSGHMGQLYYGKKIHDKEDFSYLLELVGRPMASTYFENDRSYSLEHIKQELPVYGSSDYRNPAVEILQENGSRLCDFQYESYVITPGKPKLAGLPATYTESDDEAMTLTVTVKDPVTGVKAELLYTIFANESVLARSVRYTNEGTQNLHLTVAMSMSLDLPDSDYEWIQLSGAWARERYVKTRELVQGIHAVESRRGHSSPNHNPFIALKRPGTTETQGEALGFCLVYSGNFRIQAEVDTYDTVRITAGIHPADFDWKLEPGETFQTPEAVMVYSNDGLNGMSQTYHRLFQKRLARGYWRERPRPILINNWEATYFDFTEERLIEIAGKAKECGVELFVLDDGWFGQRTRRPILINNWEATYFDFTEERLIEIAGKAKECGVELFVLDDGWFGQRTSDHAGLGDWIANPDRLPNGVPGIAQKIEDLGMKFGIWIEPEMVNENSDLYAGLGDWIANPDRLPNGVPGIAQKIEDLGMKFGIWIEPEMVNENSDLYRAHPEWVLDTPNRHRCHGRYQFVLDFSRKEVVDYIYEMLAKIFSEAKVSYVKWDMNRSITECFSDALPSDRQGEVFHRYILGVYDLYERLTSSFPHILFESCSSGGARFDAGMLYYAPQAWASDDSDAVERLKIQYGSTFCYPVSSIGSHVSVIPNHQVYRNTPLHTRANVAYFGTFGYELDLNKLPQEEIEEVKEQIRFMKEYRELLQFGTFYRLRSPFEGNETVWMVVSEDKKTALVGYYRVLNGVNGPYTRVRLQGLDPDLVYENKRNGTENYGDELMNLGLITTDSSAGEVPAGTEPCTDFDSRIYVVYENKRNGTENYGDELMNLGLITTDSSAGEVPAGTEPCTDFDSRIYVLKAKEK